MSHYNVNPRYTSGSPAMVGLGTATHVAAQEREDYKAALTGIYGDVQKERAEKLGLKGIVECILKMERNNRRDGYIVHDLLTDETYWRASNEDAKPDCREASEHEADPSSLELVLDSGGVAISVRCKLCGRRAVTKALNIFWWEEL